jgi:hypothetical protein
MEIDKHTQVGTWFIPVVVMCINPRTCDEVLSLLYYAQDSVIQIDINNKSMPQAYASQTKTCEEFKKLD